VLYYQHEVTDVGLFHWLTAPLGVSVPPIVSSPSGGLEIPGVAGAEVPRG
jgi:hypothetical protein